MHSCLPCMQSYKAFLSPISPFCSFLTTIAQASKVTRRTHVCINLATEAMRMCIYYLLASISNVSHPMHSVITVERSMHVWTYIYLHITMKYQILNSQKCAFRCSSFFKLEFNFDYIFTSSFLINSYYTLMFSCFIVSLIIQMH